MKKKILAWVLASSMLTGVLGDFGVVKAAPAPAEAAKEQNETGRETINFNTDWRYKKGDVTGADQMEFQDESWVYVNLPHSNTFYTPENKDAYLGISWYRKHFTVDEALRGKKLFLTFEAVMQKAEVYINGNHVLTHKGGYTPFVIDISDYVQYGQENVIAVQADSRPDTSFAPGKDRPDFQYFGGMYGNSYLTVTDEVHITDAVEAGVTAGGGVFVTTPQVSREEATVDVKTHVENESDQQKEIVLLTELIDQNGEIVASKEDTAVLEAEQAETLEQTMTVAQPRLWGIDAPNLYTVRSTVKEEETVKDTVETTCGIRKVEWKRDGLYLNDEKMDVNGVNLHEETYMLGNAMPDNAIYEEIKRVKENGFDIIRMAHYPHRQAYYDACDKYGVMIAECPSGWQYFNDTQEFKESTYQELRTDIRHKRNHPSIVVWETSLNESNYTWDWAVEMNRIAKEEYPTNGQAYAYTAGCLHWDVWDIGLSTPQAGIFKSTGYGAENPAYGEKPIIIAEYGDWNYGGSGSTTRVTREAVNAFGIKGGDEGMLIQADNIQESVQTNRFLGEEWLGASMYWHYADYAGFDSGLINGCGLVDVYRLPKHGAWFYRSQRSADADLSACGVESGPMVYIANAWDEKADTEIRIFSNCDTVELFLNGKSLGEQGHDATIWGPHGDGDHMNYPQEGAGKDISADALQNAPITFEVDAYEAGELRAVGKIDGEEAAEYVRRTPGQASAVELRAESDAPVPLDGSSAKLVWIDITDAQGTVVSDAYTDVELEVEGPGIVVGPNTVTTKGGQLAVWVRSKRGTGDITLRAMSGNLEAAEITISTSEVEGLPEVPEGGDVDEYEASGLDETNIFLNKSSRASSENYAGSTGAETREKANDGNESTKWCAGDGNYPQWWEADLGYVHNLETMRLAFESSGSAYYYTIAVSDEPMEDDTYQEHIVLDHSQGSTETEIQFEEPVRGRYVRVTFTAPANGEWAVIREVSGTGTSDNLALNKPVSASTVNIGGNGTERAEYAVDGNTDTYWCAVGGSGTSDHWLQVDLKDNYRLSNVNILFEKEDAAYRFVLQGSFDGVHYKTIQDFRDGDGCSGLAEIPCEEAVRYLRIYGISTGNPDSQWPAIREVAAYGEKVDAELVNVAREKEAFASSCQEGAKPEDGNNGVPGWYWYPEGMEEAWWCVDMNGLYQLDNVQMTWNAQEEHRYKIDISTNGKNWQTVVDRSQEGNSEIQPYEPVTGTARYVRVTLPAGHKEGQGFGLFGAYGLEAKSRTVSQVAGPKEVVVKTGTSFEDLGLPEEVDVILEDETATSLPVVWSEEGYDGSSEGSVTLTGTLSEIPGVLLGEIKTAQVKVTVNEDGEEPENPSDPVLQVSFDGENANDESGNDSHGTVVGSPEYVEGVSGKAIHFLNSEDRSQTATQYVDFGTPENLKFSDGDFSIAFWYKSSSDCQKEGAIVSNKDWSDGGNAGFNMGDMREGINWNFNTVESKAEGKGRVEVGRYPQATDGTWHHVVGVVDRTGEEIRLYIDGEEIASKSTQGWSGSVDVTNFVLGADGVKKRGVEDACVDELLVYKTALTEETVAEVMIDGKIALAIAEMEDQLAAMEESGDYASEAVEAMRDQINQAREELEGKDTAQKQQILADLEEAFKRFQESAWTPVLQVSFDEENANDESGNETHGTVVGNPEYVQGVRGKAIHLVNPEERTETATQYVNFGQPENLKFGTGSFTLMFWYKADTLENNTQEGSVISNKNWESGDNPGFNIGHMVQGLNLNFNTAGDDKGRAETDRFSGAVDSQWHHVAAVIDRDEMKQIALYIDGEEAFGGSGSYGSKSHTADISDYEQTVDVLDFVLGADGEKKHGVEDAYIDELLVYKDAVSQSFIQDAIADDKIDLEVAQMEEMISQAEPGCRFTEEAIANIKEEMNAAKEQLAQADAAEREEIIVQLRESYETFLEGNEPNTVFHLISDMHVTSVTGTAAENFAAGLEDMKNINPQASALISVGDNTQNGTQSEVEAFYQVLNEHHPLEDGKTMIALGNHDVRGPSSYWEDWPDGENAYWSTIYNLYMENNGQYMPDTGGKTYYDYWADGYHLIVLNPENSPKDMAYLTDEQLAWLDEKLSEQEDPAKPAIVIVHQALEETHWGSHWYNGFGPQDEAVKEILQKHPQTIVVSGHIHNGFGVNEAIDRPYGTLIDVPAFLGSNRGLSDAGTGYEVYVYDDEILFRARNFVTSTWLPQYDLSVKLKNLPTLASEAKELSQEDYTQDSWEAVSERLDAAINQADELMNKKYGTETPDEWLYHRDTREKIEDLQSEFASIFELLVEKPDSDLTLEEAIKKAQEAQKKAEEAQKAAETAKAEAEAAKADAQALKEAAEKAKNEAEAAKQAAQDAIDQAGAEGEAAKEAMQKAIEKANEAEAAKQAAEAAKTAAETAKAEAEAAKKEAEELLATARVLAEQAELKAAEAEAARKEAEAERLAAEAAKKEAEAERLKAEEAKKAAQEERRKAEEARKAAEAAKAEALKIKEELAKMQQEASGEDAEETQKVGKASLKSVKRQKKGRLKVTWKQVEGATGYEIVYSRNAKFKNAVTKKVSAKKSSLVLKKLKSKKKYYVKVRVVKKTQNGTIYGSYSKTKSQKVK